MNDLLHKFVVKNLEGFTVQNILHKEKKLAYQVIVIVEESIAVLEFYVPKFILELMEKGKI